MAANPLAASDLRRYASDTFAASAAPPPKEDTPTNTATPPSATSLGSAPAFDVQRPTPQRFLSADTVQRSRQVSRPVVADATSTGETSTPGSLSSVAQTVAQTVMRPTAISAAGTPSAGAAPPDAASVTRPTFGDVNAGSSTTGGMPRVIDDANVAGVLKNHDAAAYSAPGTNNDAAVANLLARTPTLEQGADQIARNQAVLSKDVGFNMDPAYMAQQQDKSDLGAIAVKDPRTLAGIAARNAAIDAGSSFGTRQSRAIAYNDTMQSLIDQAGAPVRAATLASKETADTQREAMRQAGDTARSNIAAQAQRYSADSKGDAVRDVAGTRGDAARYVADARGDAARDVATTRANTPKVNQAETKMFHNTYQHAYDSLTQGGMAPEEAAAQAAQFGTNAVLGYRNMNSNTPLNSNTPQGQNQPAPQPQEPPKPSAFDVQYLKSNPQMRALFDARFGKGASNLHLGNG